MQIKSDESKVDLAYLYEMADGDNSFVIDILETFIEQIPDFLRDMKQCLEDKDYATLSMHAHTAKSSVKIVGLNYLTEIMFKLEKESKENGKESDFSNYIAIFEKELIPVKIEVETIINQLKTNE